MGIHYNEVGRVSAGTRLLATGFRGTEGNIRYMQVYEVVEVQEGIFPSRPFITVTGDDGKRSTWHATRFDFMDPVENPKVGMRVRFIGRGEIDFHRGRVYGVTGILDGGVIQVTNDRGTTTFISQSNFIPYS